MRRKIPNIVWVPAALFGGEFIRFFFQQFLAATIPQDTAVSWLRTAVGLIPPWFLAGAAVGICGLLLWRYFMPADKSTGRPKLSTGPLEAVHGRTFRNERVLVDGKSFTTCRFENVTLVYNGGPVNMHDCTFAGAVFDTEDILIRSYMKMLHSLGMLGLPAMGEKGDWVQPGSGLAHHSPEKKPNS
jgi:hypothetical protein